ncbi:MAG: toprim domain-containing protein [Hyphomicrobiales bacterium]|nr:toprim domain-containing protein [Hyphomicrobiales bacterium]
MTHQKGQGHIPESVITEIVDRLALNAEAVCRRYLSQGRRQGSYWRVGDLTNTPGRSLFVRLRSGARGPAGKWTDAATGQHGDLLDIICASCALRSFSETVAEACAFLGMPIGSWNATAVPAGQRQSSVPSSSSSSGAAFSDVPSEIVFTLADSINAARRLVMASTPIAGTLAETYLRRRGLMALDGLTALRFHPTTLYRDEADQTSGAAADSSPLEEGSSQVRSARRGPALIVSITDTEGWVTGVQRTWLDRDVLMSGAPLNTRLGKVDLPDPRRSLGLIAGGAARFEALRARDGLDALLLGEGIETVLSLRAALPSVPMAATLSAAQLAAFMCPAGLHRLLIAQDNDPAGRAAAAALAARATEAGLMAVVLAPRRGDFNDDLRGDGAAGLMAYVRSQLERHGVGHLCPDAP